MDMKSTIHFGFIFSLISLVSFRFLWGVLKFEIQKFRDIDIFVCSCSTRQIIHCYWTCRFTVGDYLNCMLVLVLIHAMIFVMKRDSGWKGSKFMPAMLERLHYVIEGGVGVKQSRSHTQVSASSSISDHVLGQQSFTVQTKVHFESYHFSCYLTF